MLPWFIFAAVSGCLLYLSWDSLRHPRSHGFYRFFAWEAILALIVLNVEGWFLAPFSVRQIISWLLLIGSIVLVALGVRGLRMIGRPDASREDPALLDFEKTSTLVTQGIFGYIRHPLYSSLLCLAWGAFFKAPSWLGGGLVLAATGCLVATARVEEGECIRFFGPAYQAYMQRTRMFIPFFF